MTDLASKLAARRQKVDDEADDGYFNEYQPLEQFTKAKTSISVPGTSIGLPLNYHQSKNNNMHLH